jgi:hypothetical protein
MYSPPPQAENPLPVEGSATNPGSDNGVNQFSVSSFKFSVKACRPSAENLKLETENSL